MRRVLGSFLFPLAVAAVCALTACGGGGGGGTTPSISGGSGSSGSGGSGSGTTSIGTAPATFAVALQQYAPVQTSALKRRVAFLSPATAQISLALVSVNGVAQTGTPQIFPVGPAAPNCGSANGVVNCTLSTSLPIGTDVVSASTLDANGNSLGSSQIQATVTQNTTNRIALAVGGTIASLEIFLSNHSFTPGAPAKANVIVVPLDSSGAAIVNPGNYNPPITLGLAGSSHFDLITNGGTPAITGTINSPNDQVVLSYDGAAGNGTTTVTASAGSPVTPASTTAGFSSSSLYATPQGLQYVTTSSFIFTAAAQADAIVAGGGTGPYTITSSNTAVATVGGTSPNFTVTSVGYGTSGTATLTITDSATPTAATTTIPVTFQASPISLGVTTCGSGATCSVYSVSGPLVASTITATGGTGSYSYIFANSNSTTSAYATVSQTGGAFTITPNGTGNDALIIFSGNSSAYYGVLSNKNALVQSLPKALGFRVNKLTSISVGAAGETITSCPVTSGSLPSLSLVGGAPGTLSATSTGTQVGVITCTDSLGYSLPLNFDSFATAFGTYQGAGGSSNPNATADEAFTSTGETDVVTVTTGGPALASAVSGNTGIVTVGTIVSGVFTVMSHGVGTTTVTLTDALGASVTYSVSVTTTTIPIASHARLQ